MNSFFPKNIGTLHWGKRGRIDKYAQVTRSKLDPLCIVIHFLDPRSLICYLYSTINIVTREQIAICPICPQCKDIIIGCLESWHFLIVSGKIRVKNRQQNQYSPKSKDQPWCHQYTAVETTIISKYLPNLKKVFCTFSDELNILHILNIF